METIILVALAGLAWGSFLNVVIHRLPRGMSLFRPPSSCPSCGARLKAYDNIPFVSFLLLKGRCRSCRTKIPLSYPLVETLTPLSFLLLYSHHSLSLHFFASSLFASALLALAVIDYYHQVLPDEITLPGLVLAVIYAIFRPDLSLRQALVGAVVGATFLLFVYGAYYLFRKKEGLGMGDVTLMLMIGAYLGWLKALFTLMVASFAGALVGLLVIAFHKKDLQYALPYGSFLAPAAFLSLVWGEGLLGAYLGLFLDKVP